VIGSFGQINGMFELLWEWLSFCLADWRHEAA